MPEKQSFKAGDKVALVSGSYSRTHVAGIHKIERETKTQYIVNGRRFRKSDNYEVGERSAWTPQTEIMATDSPRVLRALSEQRISTSYSKALGAISDYEKDRNNIVLLENAIGALQAHRTVMETEGTK